jgi:hypothetical protein
MRGHIGSARHASKQDGFVLVLTLSVLVIVAIAAGYFSERVASAVETAQQSRQNSDALIDMASVRAEVMYRLGTTTLTQYGLGRGDATVYLDNRPYRGEGNTLVRLQDNRGLLNLNLIDDGRLNRFLGLLGIEAEQRSHLMDTLRDYTQSSRMHRLNGAGDEEYAARNLPLPSHRNLVTPWETKRIIGWSTRPELWQGDRLVNLVSTGQSMGINPNTAPVEVLATLPGVTQEFAQIIIARRKLAPLTHEGQIVAITGMPLDLPMGMGIIAIPSDTLRVTQSAAGLPWVIQYSIRLTPNGKDAPWRTEYYSRISSNPTAPTIVDISELPPRAIAPPDKVPAFLLPG